MIKTENFVVDFGHTKDPEIINELIGAPFSQAKAATSCLITKNEPPVLLAGEWITPFVAQGNAFCTINDQFIKAVGRKIALRKAVRQIDNAEHRTEIWKAYLSVVKKP